MTDLFRIDLPAQIAKQLSLLSESYQTALDEGASPFEADHLLCEQGILTEAELYQIYASVTGLEVKEEEEIEHPERVNRISASYLNTKQCIPILFSEEDKVLMIALSSPYSASEVKMALKRLFGDFDIRFCLARRSVIERLLTIIYEDESENDFSSSMQQEEALRNLASEARVVRLVNELFTRALEMETSDIHVEPEEDRLVIRFRVDGILQEALVTPLSQYPAIASRIKLIAGMNIAESRLPQDGRVNLKIGRTELDMRASTIPIMNGESIVLRLLRKDAMQYDLAKIGMNPDLLEKFSELIQLPHGMILVVGPTGSGKTTTLYSVMSRLNTPDVKIITIEDPVEYRMSRLSQMQVNAKIGLDFANGLRNIVRQDPDIILVGEIRDRETADIAINAALTGHLVFSTLHTNDAAGAVSRLVDMGVENFLIASALSGVLSQRLVRTLCKSCKGKGILEDHSRCKACSGTGFKGRTAIYELLIVDEDIRKAILRSAPNSEIAAIAVKNGMIPLLEDGKRKVAEGITTAVELATAAHE